MNAALDRVFGHKWTTIIGLVLAGLVEVSNEILGDGAFNPKIHAIAALVIAIGAAMKDPGKKGAPTVPPAAVLAIVFLLGLSGCAALSAAQGTTGNIDLGKGVLCSITAGATDATSCLKPLSQTCQVPMPKDSSGACLFDNVQLDIPFNPGPGSSCAIITKPGEACTRLLTTACVVPVGKNPDGSCR